MIFIFIFFPVWKVYYGNGESSYKLAVLICSGSSDGCSLPLSVEKKSAVLNSEAL